MNFKKILKKHKICLKNEKGEKCCRTCRRDKDGNKIYYYTPLREGASIGGNLRGADLRGVNLIGINLTGADLSGANLSNANLSYADLSGADLWNANLWNANLENANLWNADLTDANLKNIKTNTNTIGYHLACPEEGSFIGYKKANRYLIKLLIPENAKRSSATTLKCRCSEARVLDIEDIKTGLKVQAVNSSYDYQFIYRVGEIVKVEDFDDNRWNECSTGIHFFMNKDNAINY